MIDRRFPIFTCGVILLGLSASKIRADNGVDYLRSVKPIFAGHCYNCHGAIKQKGKLRLDTVALMKKGGANGPVVVAGTSAKSLLFEHIASADSMNRMPPPSEGDALKPADIATIKAWIDQGAAGPVNEKPETDPKNHWAFKTPMRPNVPQSQFSNPIDAFLDVARQERNLKQQGPADNRLLLRRVYLDLIGLPPTLDEQDAFDKTCAAKPQAAFEEVVDHLLASKQYGERWGRHWMDVWRYSDWWGLGSELRNSQKHIWHWRDWIIESLNADMGYDRMVREMLAADELDPTDADNLRATGFLARQYFLFNRNTWMEETVEHTSKAFLGLTMNCCKCHDHKYDPLSQPDFYRFRAFFEPYQVRTDMTPGETDFGKDGIPRVFDCNLEAPTYLFVRGDEKNPRKDKPILPGVPDILSFRKIDMAPINLPVEAHAPQLKALVLETLLKQAEAKIAAARATLVKAKMAMPVTEKTRAVLQVAEKALATAERQPALLRACDAADRARLGLPPLPDRMNLIRKAALLEKQMTVAVADEAVARAELAKLEAADPKKAEADKMLSAAKDVLSKAKTDAEEPGETYTSLRGSLKTPENNVESEASRNKPFPTTSTGRRSALAKWITDARNPLTARVAVNHIWARHFGKPLVASVFDFGRNGSPPTHPELLDYLAVELMEKNWSMKHLHRLIVTSSAYRMSSSAKTSGDSDNPQSIDAENRYYWRMNPVRMESEVIRDSLLSLSGELDLKMGGPSIAVNDEASRRRSLYFVHSHNEHHRFLSTFDDASVLECYRRAESIVPQQALTLENSKLAMAAAKKIAKRIVAKDDAAFIVAAFETVLGSAPTAEEKVECARAMKELIAFAAREKKPDGALRARINLVHALLNHNDFVTVR